MTLYVSDLDGTLLDRSGNLSKRSREGLTRLLDQGLLFTVASARHVSSIRTVLGDLPLRLPVISGNGACISELHSGRHELVRTMEPNVAQSIFALIRLHGLLPFFSTHSSSHGDRLYYQSAANAGQQSFIDERISTGDPRLRQSDQLHQHVGAPVVTFVVVDREPALVALQSAVRALCGNAVEVHLQEDMYTPNWPWLSTPVFDIASGRDLRGAKCSALIEHRPTAQRMENSSHLGAGFLRQCPGK